MSIAAQKWAMEQRIGSAGTKFVLWALASYADVNGACWPSHETLADATDQSVSTIQRCLKALEERGLVYIGPRRIKPSGRAGARQYVVLHDDACVAFALEIGFDPENVGKKGRKSALEDEAAGEVPCDQDVDEIQTGQYDRSAENDVEEIQADGGKGHENRPVNLTDQPDAVLTGQSDRSADRSPVTGHSVELSTLNLSPVVPDTPSSGVGLDSNSWLGSWKRFEAVWPWRGSDAPARIREKIRQMLPDDRAALIEAAEAYLADCRIKHKPACSARGFVVLGAWREWVDARSARGQKLRQRQIGEQVFVVEGTDAWKAWLAAKGVKAFPTTMRLVDGKPRRGWWFPTLFPPRRALSGADPPPGDPLADFVA